MIKKNVFWGMLIFFLSLTLLPGCGTPQQNKPQEKESRWILVEDDHDMPVFLDKQSITRNKESGSDMTRDATKYKVVQRDVVSCWIKVEIKESAKKVLVEQLNIKYPKLNAKSATLLMENIKFDLLTREYMSVEEVIFDGKEELTRGNVSNKWQSMRPGEKIYEAVFEAVKKQIGK